MGVRYELVADCGCQQNRQNRRFNTGHLFQESDALLALCQLSSSSS
jgi:hypothetical protein